MSVFVFVETRRWTCKVGVYFKGKNKTSSAPVVLIYRRLADRVERPVVVEERRLDGIQYCPSNSHRGLTLCAYWGFSALILNDSVAG